jgi:hypothetical protein
MVSGSRLRRLERPAGAARGTQHDGHQSAGCCPESMTLGSCSNWCVGGSPRRQSDPSGNRALDHERPPSSSIREGRRAGGTRAARPQVGRSARTAGEMPTYIKHNSRRRGGIAQAVGAPDRHSCSERKRGLPLAFFRLSLGQGKAWTPTWPRTPCIGSSPLRPRSHNSGSTTPTHSFGLKCVRPTMNLLQESEAIESSPREIDGLMVRGLSVGGRSALKALRWLVSHGAESRMSCFPYAGW